MFRRLTALALMLALMFGFVLTAAVPAEAHLSNGVHNHYYSDLSGKWCRDLADEELGPNNDVYRCRWQPQQCWANPAGGYTWAAWIDYYDVNGNYILSDVYRSSGACSP